VYVLFTSVILTRHRHTAILKLFPTSAHYVGATEWQIRTKSCGSEITSR